MELFTTSNPFKSETHLILFFWIFELTHTSLFFSVSDLCFLGNHRRRRRRRRRRRNLHCSLTAITTIAATTSPSALSLCLCRLFISFSGKTLLFMLYILLRLLRFLVTAQSCVLLLADFLFH